MDKRNQTETETLLQQWRTRILNWVLTILALTLIPVIITMYLRDLANPSQWGYIYALTAIGGVLIVVAVFRNIAYLIRVLCIVLLGFAAGIINLRMTGLVVDLHRLDRGDFDMTAFAFDTFFQICHLVSL